MRFVFIQDAEVVNTSHGGHESTPPTTTSSIASALSEQQPHSNRLPHVARHEPQTSSVPMPTLYNDSTTDNDSRGGKGQPRMGTIEVLLYNMASMLAGVAAGYDVRLSNVSPIHPKLYPKR